MEIDLYLNDAQHEWLIAVIFSHCTFHVFSFFFFFTWALFLSSAFLMCRRGPINVKKPQTKWQLQNANCTFCSFTFFVPLQCCRVYYRVWHGIVYWHCDMRWMCSREKNGWQKMDTFANLMFVENIKQLTASI